MSFIVTEYYLLYDHPAFSRLAPLAHYSTEAIAGEISGIMRAIGHHHDHPTVLAILI